MLLAAQAREAIRVKAFEPADVAQELHDTELVKGDAVAAAQLAEAAARNAAGPEADEARELADIHNQVAEELSVRAAWLGEQDEHRREWHSTHAEKMARGVQARAELERRREAGELIGVGRRQRISDLEFGHGTTQGEADPEPEAEAETAAEAVNAEPETETEPTAEAAPETEAEPEPTDEVVDTLETAPEPEVIRPMGSDGEWFIERARREAEAKAEAETPEPEPQTEPVAEAEPEIEPESPGAGARDRA